MKFTLLTPFLFLFCLLLHSIAAAPFEHPRLFIDQSEIPAFQAKLQTEPYSTWLERMVKTVDTEKEVLNTEDPYIYDVAYLAGNAGFLYLCTEDSKWSDVAWKACVIVMENEEFTLDPYSFGLTRAANLKALTLAYDFAYHGWTREQQERVNAAIYALMNNVSATMGYVANYSTASNWMGVRWGSVMLASYAVDFEKAEGQRRTPAQAYQWDSINRLRTHIKENAFSNGWNGESLGYFNYNWSFVGPAMLAFHHHSNMQPGEVIDMLMPHMENALHGVATAALPILAGGSAGMKPDLSDDNLNMYASHLLGMGLELYPEEQHPYIKWAHDSFFNAHLRSHPRPWDIFSFFYHDPETASINPAEAGWLNYHDPEQGITLFRNRFQDENDTVFTYTATATRIRGHSGPDTNTYRLFGLGVPWIIGGGRTSELAAQTNLFPSYEATKQRGSKKHLGVLHDFEFLESGGGFAHGSGSITGVTNHHRKMQVAFDETLGVEAAILIQEKSDDGALLRICTPEFIEFVENENGFTLTALNGAQLHYITHSDYPFSVNTSKVRYGGATVRHNPGIRYLDGAYGESIAIDISTKDGDLKYALILQEADAPKPDYSWSGDTLQVGSKTLTLK